MDSPETGFFGKVPSNGDFVQRRLPKDFVTPWDAWLQSGLLTAKNTLGDEWLETYLNAPLWRFLLTPGVCGESGWAGVMMPSVDKVGRYFPLTLAGALPLEGFSAQRAIDHTQWFVDAENVLLSALEDGRMLEALDDDVRSLRLDDVPRSKDFLHAASLDRQQADLWILPAGDSGVGGSLHGLADIFLEQTFDHHCLWWTEGGEHFAPLTLVTSSLPDPSRFLVFLTGGASLPESAPPLANSEIEEAEAALANGDDE